MSASRPLGRRTRLLVAVGTAFLSVLLNTGYVLADQANGDSDLVAPGNQASVDLTASPGQTVGFSAQIVITRQGSKHLGPSQTVTYRVVGAPTTLPAPYTVSDALVAIPAGWSAADNGTIATGTSSVSFAAPATAGSYTYAVQWDSLPGYACVSSPCLGGTPNYAVNLTVTAPADTTAPTTAIALTPALPDGDNGWYRSAVAARVSASDPDDAVAHTYCVLDPATPPAGFSSLPPSCLFGGVGSSVTGAGAHTLYAASVDSHGNQESPLVSTTFKIDSTPPLISYLGASPAPNANGWNTSAVSLSWSCTDSTSGVVAATVSEVIDTDGTGQQATGACRDLAGNTSTSTDGSVDIDRVGPATGIALTPSEPDGDHGWYKSPVTVSVSATDANDSASSNCVIDPALAPTAFSDLPTGCAFTSPGAEVTTDGQHAVYAASVDGNGNQEASIASAAFKIDSTPPVITFTGQTPAANAEGWNSTDVTLTWTCSDAESGAVLPVVTQTLTGEGADLGATGSCRDLAGNTATDTRGGVNIDRTGPTITFAGQIPAANANGWNNSDVTLTWACADSLSGVVLDEVSRTLSEEGAGQEATASCEDLTGNTSTDTRGGVNIDRTPPVVTFTGQSPAANANGWNNSAVTLAWSCADPLSNVADSSSTRTITAEGAHLQATGACEDLAGNTAQSTDGDVSIDETPPVIAFSGQDPAANANGWNNTDVTLEWSCSDTLSNVVDSTVSHGITGEGVHLQATGECGDRAGNTSQSTDGDVSIDRTAPTIAFAGQSPAANANGWNNSDVTLAWTCTDALSSPVSTSVIATITVEGSGRQATGTCQDLAGNTASSTDGDVNLDRTAPVITFAGQSPAANAAGWNNSDVTLTWTCVDALSTPVAASVTRTISTEGSGQHATGTCQDLAGNSASSTDGSVNLDRTSPALSPTVAPDPVLLDGAATATPNASDPGGSGVSSASCASVDTSHPGGHTVSCTATDRAGNSRSGLAAYTVVYGFSGFLSPLNPNPTVLNTGNAGRTYPLKWQLTDAFGRFVTDAVPTTTIHLYTVSCPGAIASDPIDQPIAAAGASVLRYDSTANQYVYNWATPASKGACYRLLVTTPDSVPHTALFQMK